MPTRLLFVAALMFSLTSYCYSSGQRFVVGLDRFYLNIVSDRIVIEKNGVELLNKSVPDYSDGSIVISDFNFDGYPDFGLLRDSGIEKYFDVYVFNKNKQMYEVSEFLSSIPCPVVDAKRKIVSSTCNHGSACENWQDHYEYKNSRFVLIRRDGVTCDPESGASYKYFEIFKSGRLIRNKTTRIKN